MGGSSRWGREGRAGTEGAGTGAGTAPLPESARLRALPGRKPLDGVVAMRRSFPPRLVVEKYRHMLPSMGAAIALALLPGAFFSGSAAAAPLFAAPFLSFDTGTFPTSVAVGDLNGDGKPDLAAANHASSNSGSVMLAVRHGN